MLDKPYIEEPDMSGLPDAEVAARTWANYRARNDSSMVDHFQARLPLAPQSHPLSFPLHEPTTARATPRPWWTISRRALALAPQSRPLRLPFMK